MKGIFTLILLLGALISDAQTVSTFYQNADIDDGLAIDNLGNLYGSRYTGSKSFLLRKVPLGRICKLTSRTQAKMVIRRRGATL